MLHSSMHGKQMYCRLNKGLLRVFYVITCYKASKKLPCRQRTYFTSILFLENRRKVKRVLFLKCPCLSGLSIDLARYVAGLLMFYGR